MDAIAELVNDAMIQWDKDTNTGDTDPAFQGELGAEIDRFAHRMEGRELLSHGLYMRGGSPE